MIGTGRSKQIKMLRIACLQLSHGIHNLICRKEKKENERLVFTFQARINQTISFQSLPCELCPWHKTLPGNFSTHNTERECLGHCNVSSFILGVQPYLKVLSGKIQEIIYQKSTRKRLCQPSKSWTSCKVEISESGASLKEVRQVHSCLAAQS